MKAALFILALVFNINCYSQRLQVISEKDSLPIPYATVSIKNSFIYFAKTSNDKGIITFSGNDDDSSLYTLMAYAVGFEKFSKVLMGVEVNKLKQIYLTPINMNLNEVVITAQYTPTQVNDAVQKVQVIDRAKIDQMGAVNLKDVMSNQLNVRLQQDNVLGSGMSLQGVSGENIKILVDGVPMIGRLNGNIDMSQINLNNVDHIEFIEGPLSVQYGTNALAGTINIITKKGIDKKITTDLTSYYESIGTYNLNVGGTFYHKKSYVQVNGGRNYFDGWNPNDEAFYFPKPHIADSTRHKQWKPKEQYFTSLNYLYTFKKLAAGFKSNYFNEVIINRGYPRAPYAETSFDDYYYTKRFDNNIFANGSISKNWKINTLLAYNYYSRIKKTVYKDLTTLDEVLSANSSDQDTSEFGLIMSRASFTHVKDSSKLNYELGYDVNYESALGKRIDKQIQYMGDYAGFATLEYKPYSRLIFKPGLRYSYNTAYKTPVIPSFNVKWSLNSRHLLRASYARGFRAPSLKELYFLFIDINHNIVGNQNLKAEQSDNFSVAYNYKEIFNNTKVIFDASVFYNSIYNLITLAQTSGTEYSYVNIGKYKTIGAQLSTKVKYKELSIQLGGTYTGRYNELTETNAIPMFNYSPEGQANISYTIKKHKTNVSIFYKYNGKLLGYNLVNDQVQQTFMSEYHTMDITGSKLFWKERAGITIGCKNIFDIKNLTSTATSSGVHSASPSSIPLSTGRNYFIKLSLNFQSK